MKTLTIGILAHVDAGKTSLTERLLFETGVIGQAGSVKAGDTQTDSLDLERRRGITITSSVVAVSTPDHRITLVDTPGHSDFIAEVERALGVLDGAVLVVSAVEGVQAQTRVLMRTLIRLGIPTLVFVNKTDRPGARPDELPDLLRTKLSPKCVALTEELTDALATDEDFLASYVSGSTSEVDCRKALVRQVGRAEVYPVLFGSAITGAGVRELVDAVRELLPARERSADGPLEATVFKIERGRSGEKVAYVRVSSGSLAARQQIPLRRRTEDGVLELTGKPSAVRIYEHGATPAEGVACAGDVARVRGLPEARIGDRIGDHTDLPGRRFFAPPSLETIVRPADPEHRAALHTALERLSEQDPFIRVRRQDHELTVRLYGEVQKEVLRTRLAEEFGLTAEFEESRPLCVERLRGTGHRMRNPAPDERVYFWATVGLRVEPRPAGSGTAYRREVELGALPLAFHKAIEETVHETLRRGPHGWEVIDCLVTLTETAFYAPLSSAGDFRGMTRLVLDEALRRAGTRVHEPVHSFEVSAPAGTVSTVLRGLVDLGATPGEPVVSGDGCTVTGLLPAAVAHEFEQALPGLTQGEGTFASSFAEYRVRPDGGGPRRVPPSRRARTAQ
ncbi:elongation factor G [Amycolatopsis jiangsuensis]|uniref:Ribosomal protection tetracycline resistance protein n=1 Tax=Amycolatopsis jiangsuensis TaxID=1181879 RepID=A0A840IWP3_9PSEU|nr:TetM/TetW/TetO/TetS family tetracycline resistance ribosomal protection protein [Amycolatopsis jiangsuensis]MBB4686143.1 ribosomal protection tetracycline resistance protein [Amycolatopsis jiangsuensis]